MADNVPESEQAERARRQDEARRALEGEEWRQRRETRAQLAARQAAAREHASVAKQAETEAEIAAKEEARRAAAAEAEAVEADYGKRVDKISTAKQTINELKTSKVMMSPIRTLKSDMARVVKEDGISISSIAMSEQARKRFGLAPAGKMPQPPNAFLPYLLFMLFVVAAGGGVYWWWRATERYYPTIATNISAVQTPFIFAEATKNLSLSGPAATIREAINQEASDTRGGWTVKNLAFTQDNAGVSWRRLAQSLEIKMPDLLNKSLAAQYMFGLLKEGGDTSRFLLLKTSFPDQAYAGLYDWESAAMADQLLPLLYATPPTRSTTNRFSDKLVRNKDARILSTSDGRILLLYAFLDGETIIITPNQETFLAVFDRFANDETL